MSPLLIELFWPKRIFVVGLYYFILPLFFLAQPQLAPYDMIWYDISDHIDNNFYAAFSDNTIHGSRTHI